MAKNNNLTDFLTDIANTIRTKKGTQELINPQNFSSEISSIQTNNFAKKYVTQTIIGDTCSLSISDTGNETDAKMVGQVNGKLYIVEV